MSVRLHKFLARAGVASRRACEELIAQGRVTVDGVAVTGMGTVVDPSRQVIRFDGVLVKEVPPVHFLVYKPAGTVCTSHDQFGRPSVVDLVPYKDKERLFPVGRLEEDSEGLILVTNDGTFANKLLKGRPQLRQTWFVRVRGTIDWEAVERIRQGVWLSDGRTAPMWVKPLRMGKRTASLLISPAAYQHRVLRRVLARVGVNPDRVVRTRIGPLSAEGLKRGTARRLLPEEVERLLAPHPEDVGFGELSTHARQRGKAAFEGKTAARTRAQQRTKAARKAKAARRKAGAPRPPRGGGRRVIGP